MPACPTCGEDNPERARFCLRCGSPLAVGAPRGERRKTVTIVFSDLKGSTELGEALDPESVRRVIERYFAAMRASLERHGGTVEKFIGDAVMAVFGIPTIHEDDPLRAVTAAQDMRRALSELNDELERRWGVRLEARTGVNTGEVIAGDPAQGQAFATGDAVNVAARLEQAAEAGQVLIGPETERLVRDTVQVEAVAPLKLKGKSEPMPAFRLVAVSARPPGLSRRLDSLLVGRDGELALLGERFARTEAERSCQLVTVLGEAGVGKSRLAHAFTAGLRERARVLRGRCLAYGDGITFWPVAEVVREAAGIDEQRTTEEARAKLRAMLAGVDEADAILEAVAGAIGLGEAGSDPQTTFWAVRRLFEVLAQEHPLVVVFDDLQWAEQTFLNLLSQLTERSGAAILLLCLARPELRELCPALAAKDGRSFTLSLAPLGEEESRRLIAGLLGDAVMAEELAGRIGPAAAGNPLFVEELVHKLVEDGLLVREQGGWRLRGELSAVAVPATLRGLLAARLDRLADEERTLLERAAVAGEELWPSAVAELSPEISPAVFRDRFEALVTKDLVQPVARRFAGEEGFRFAHSLIRDVAYDGLLKQARSELHVGFAGWLEQRAGERAGEYEEILGYHLERAFRYREALGPLDEAGRVLAGRAAARLGRAGRRALARGDTPAAVNLLERALSLLTDDDPAWRELSLKLGIAVAESGELARADALLDERIESERRGQAFLKYRDGAGRQQLFDLEGKGPRVTIGRRAANDVSLGWDSEVSRVHAALERRDGGWALADAGLSRNGSYLNAERVSGSHRLRDGDVLRFGDTVILYRAPAQTAPPVVAPDESGVTALGRHLSRGMDLSQMERAVLSALARRLRDPDVPAASVTDALIAADISSRVDQVASTLQALARMFAVEHETPHRRRELVVERALDRGLISRRTWASEGPKDHP